MGYRLRLGAGAEGYSPSPAAHTGRRDVSGEAASILVRYKYGRSRKIFLALSRDVGTVRVHRDSEALCRCKSGTGPRPGIMSASSGSVFIIAALDHLTCQVSVANDGAREDCRASTVRSEEMTYTFQSISAVTTYH